MCSFKKLKTSIYKYDNVVVKLVLCNKKVLGFEFLAMDLMLHAYSKSL